MTNRAFQAMLLAAFAVAACSPPTSSPGATPSAAVSSPSASPSATATTFVIPKPTEEPKTEIALANATYTQPDLPTEMKAVFQLIYKARTLPRGGRFDVPALAGLVAGPYADYTLPLFAREVRDAQAGGLLEGSVTHLARSHVFLIRNEDPHRGHAQATGSRTSVA